MSKKISLFGRKRLSELAGGVDEVTEHKKDELLALKLQEINNEAEATGSLQQLPVSLLMPDPNQPRKTFHNIETLSASIREKGIIQPIIVKTRNVEGHYPIIAGERRFRAAKQAGLNTVPCIVRDENDANIVILQLLENNQRDDVSPLEESDALMKLINEMKLSKWQVAKELGRDPGWISIRLGLQQASPSIKSLVSEGIIEDVRTLHELRMLEAENAKAAQQLIDRIRKNQVSGSYRQAIAEARVKRSGRASSARVRSIKSIEKVGDELILHVGGKHPLHFSVSPEVLTKFLNQLLREKAK
jgi:ParB family chromosome partitioning protein